MRFPWTRETRQDTDYGDALLTAIFQQAQGTSGPIKARIGAVAAAAGWWARAFASAKLTRASLRTPSVQPFEVTPGASLSYAVRPSLSWTARAA